MAGQVVNFSVSATIQTGTTLNEVSTKLDGENQTANAIQSLLDTLSWIQKETSSNEQAA
jgi:hypothetical protein